MFLIDPSSIVQNTDFEILGTALRTKAFYLEEANKELEEKIKRTLEDYSSLEKDFEGKSFTCHFQLLCC